jgi:hypothetical protein
MNQNLRVYTHKDDTMKLDTEPLAAALSQWAEVFAFLQLQFNQNLKSVKS